MKGVTDAEPSRPWSRVQDTEGRADGLQDRPEGEKDMWGLGTFVFPSIEIDPFQVLILTILAIPMALLDGILSLFGGSLF